MQHKVWPVKLMTRVKDADGEYCTKGAYPNSTTRSYGSTFSSRESVLSVYRGADCAKKETERRSVSGVAVIYGGVAVSSSS